MPGSARKSAHGRSSTKGPQIPASCLMRLSGPTMVLSGEVRQHPAACLPTGSSSLLLTGGRRVGHAAALCPDDRNVIVVVGGSVLAAAPDAGQDAMEETVLTLAGCGCGDGGVEAGKASGQGSAPTSPLQGVTPSEPTLPLVRHGATVEVPAAWRTPFPFVECYHVERGVWFVPPGQQRRSDAVGGGAMRWPTQAAPVFQWEGEAPQLSPHNAAPLPLVPRAGRHPTDSPARSGEDPTDGDGDASEELGQDGSTSAASSTPRGHRRADGTRSSSPKKKRKPSPSTFDRLTYARPRRTPRERKAKTSDVIAAAPPNEGGGGPEATEAYHPVGLSMPERKGAGTAAHPYLATASAATASVPSVRPPTDVLLVGGWDGAARLSTVMTYHTGEVPRDVTDVEVAAAYTLPDVSELPAFPAVSHHTCTPIKGSVYCFGGNALGGCGSVVRVLTNARLRRAYAKEMEARAARQRQELRQRRNSAATNGTARSFILGASTLSMSHRSEEGPRATHLARSQAATEAADEEAGGAEVRLPGEVQGTDGWGCAAVTWPPPPPPAADSRPGTPSAPAAAEEEAEAAPPRAAAVVVPAPPPRSSHAAECLANRFLVIYGGRQLVLPTDTNAADTKGRRAKSVTKRSASPGAQGGGAGAAAAAAAKRKRTVKGRPGEGVAPLLGAWETEEGALPTLTVLGDVAVFDTEEHRWLQATITSGEAPEPRYGAAVCPLPTGGATTTNGAPTELFLHGGVAEDGRVLGDAWVLAPAAPPSVLSAAEASLKAHGAGRGGKRRAPGAASATASTSGGEAKPASATAHPLVVEVDPLTGAPAVFLRWVRVELPSSTAVPRAHHAAVATPQREVFLIGGRTAEPVPAALSDVQTGVPAGEPVPSTQAPAGEETCLVSLTVPPLVRLTEGPPAVSQHTGRSLSKGK